jgi:hypothetical protein
MDIEEIHKIACEEEKQMFLNPETGLYSMTAVYLKSRGKCCGNKCMFCPWGHVNVKNHVCDDKCKKIVL